MSKTSSCFLLCICPFKTSPSSFLYINNQVLHSSCVCQNPWNCPWPFSFSHVSSSLTANHVSFAVKYIQRLSFSSITTSPLNQASIISHLDYLSTSLTSLFVPILGFSRVYSKHAGQSEPVNMSSHVTSLLKASGLLHSSFPLSGQLSHIYP